MTIPSVVSAHKKGDVTITDILQDVLRSYTDEYIILLFCNQMVELMVHILRACYKRFVHLDKKTKENPILESEESYVRDIMCSINHLKNLSKQMLK